MRLIEYFHERWLTYVFLLATYGFAWAVYKLDIGLNLTESNALYILAGWALFLVIFIPLDYYTLSNRLRQLKEHIEVNPSGDPEQFSYPVEQEIARKVGKLAGDFESYKAGIRTKSAEQLDFITKWLHDVKVPIAAARLILENQEGEIPQDFYQSLDQELTTIEEAIQKVFYEIKSGSFHDDYKISPVSTRKLIATALKGYSNLFSYKKLDIEIAGDEYRVLTDEKWSGYILSQLVSNAVKYTPVGGKISISTQKTDNRVTIAVKNTGKGIPSQDLGQVFKKGYTSSEERAGSTATGYGLYLSKKLADVLGHVLEVDSKYGEYAVFYLTFIEPQTVFDVTKM